MDGLQRTQSTRKFTTKFKTLLGTSSGGQSSVNLNANKQNTASQSSANLKTHATTSSANKNDYLTFQSSGEKKPRSPFLQVKKSSDDRMASPRNVGHVEQSPPQQQQQSPTLAMKPLPTPPPKLSLQQLLTPRGDRERKRREKDPEKEEMNSKESSEEEDDEIDSALTSFVLTKTFSQRGLTPRSSPLTRDNASSNVNNNKGLSSASKTVMQSQARLAVPSLLLVPNRSGDGHAALTPRSAHLATRSQPHQLSYNPALSPRNKLNLQASVSESMRASPSDASLLNLRNVNNTNSSKILISPRGRVLPTQSGSDPSEIKHSAPPTPISTSDGTDGSETTSTAVTTTTATPHQPSPQSQPASKSALTRKLHATKTNRDFRALLRSSRELVEGSMSSAELSESDSLSFTSSGGGVRTNATASPIPTASNSATSSFYSATLASPAERQDAMGSGNVPLDDASSLLDPNAAKKPEKKKIFETLRETWRNAQQKWKLALIFFVIYIIYISIGISYYYFVDHWKFVDSVYFTLVTITTVGYGDIKPTTTDSKIFTGVYIILGVGIIGYSLSVMGEYITSRQEKILTEALQMTDMPILINEEDEETENSDQVSVNENGDVIVPMSLTSAPPPANPPTTLAARLFARFWKWRKVFYSISGVMLVIVVGSLFSVLHMGMDVPTAFYFSIVTSTTVGYGDYYGTTDTEKWFLVFFISISTFVVAASFGVFIDIIIDREQVKMMERFLEKDFTFEVMEFMDSNNDGKVDINEFVESMILEMGRISASELSKIKLRFQQLDVEGKGYLDLNAMVEC